MIVVTAATRQELSCLAGKISKVTCPDIPGLPIFTCRIRERDFLLLRTGVGFKKAGAAGRRLLRFCSPGAVISIGAAGAADPALAVGDMVLCESILHRQSELGFRSDERLAETIAQKLIAAGLPVLRGDCCTVDTFIHTAGEKSNIFERTGARVIDMESAALARCCADSAIPFAGIRIVSDAAHADIFDINAFYACKKKSGRVGAWKYFAGNPAELVRVLSLRRHLIGVSRKIAEVVDVLFEGESITAAAGAL